MGGSQSTSGTCGSWDQIRSFGNPSSMFYQLSYFLGHKELNVCFKRFIYSLTREKKVGERRENLRITP